ncbi:MAG: thioredoxin family protein [Bacteroidetes bacterium]|nr:thioredoxin family protein [Fibrella sp.]
MKPDDLLTVSLSPPSAVLLVFTPSAWADRGQQASLTALTDRLQAQFGGLLRILRINEAMNPDVVRSFAITQTPAFVLVRQGTELWRQVGLSDEIPFALSIQRLLTA